MSKSQPIVFRYKLVAGWWSPMISAGVDLGGTWQPVELYVDSGASYTILRPKVAQELGFDWASGRKVFVQVGDGSRIPVHLHNLGMQIGPTRFMATVGFSDKLGGWIPFAGAAGRVPALQDFLS